MKKNKILIVIAIVLLITASLVGCTDVAVDKIELSETPTITSHVGEDLAFTGGKIKATYTDGKIKEDIAVTKDMITGFDKTLKTEQTLTVTYETKTVTFKATLTEKAPIVTLESIAVKTAPKVAYVVGQTFSGVGLVLTATYSDETEKDVTFGAEGVVITFDKTGALAVTDTKVVATYMEKNVDIAITVIEKAVTAIEVKTVPTKVAYVAGQTFSGEGLVLNVTYNDGTEKDVTFGAESGITFDKTGALAVTDTKVVATYDGKTADITITVVAKAITGVTVKTQPTDVEYFAGQIFDGTGLVLTATYNDGSTTDITYGAESGITFDKTGALAVTDTKVVATYDGKTADITITVTVTDYSTYDITYETPDQVKAGIGVKLPITLAAIENRGIGYEKVLIYVTVTKPDGSTVKLMATDTDGKEWDVAKIGAWGPSGGFDIAADYRATTDFTATFSMAGHYTVKVAVREVDSEIEIVAKDIEVDVVGYSTYEIISNDDATYVANEPTKFSSTLAALKNNGLGYEKVLIYVTVTSPNGGSVKLMATDTKGNELDVAKIGYWGPSGGFDIAADYRATTDFTATFATAGHYTVKVAVREVDSEIEIVAKDIEVDVVGYSTYDITYETPDQVKAGIGVKLPITLAAIENRGIGYEKVLIYVTVTKPDGSTVKLMATDTDGKEWDVAKIGAWGPSGGFDIAAGYRATTDFTATFSMAGHYTVKVAVREVDSEIEIVAKDIDVDVVDYSTYDITSNDDATYVANEPTKFSSTLAVLKNNGLGYEKVLIYVTVTSPDGGSVKLMATDTDGKEWDVAKIGAWGPSGGFDIAADYRAITEFTATFATAGKYVILAEVCVLDADNVKGTVICSSQSDITVQARSTYAITSEVTAETIAVDQDVEFTATLKATDIKDLGYEKVLIYVTVTKPDGSTVKLMAKDTNGNELDIADIGHWGPSSGFPISAKYDAITNCTASFTMAGEYTFTTEVYTLNAENAKDKLVCAATASITVV